MNPRANRRRPWILVLVGVLVLAAVIGYQMVLAPTTVVLWGVFRVPTAQLIAVQVDITRGTTSHAYAIHNPRLVRQIADAVADMRRAAPPTPSRPPLDHPIWQFTIRARHYGIIGGSLWVVGRNGSTVWQDANGYYWKVPKSLIHRLERDLRAPSTTRIF